MSYDYNNNPNNQNPYANPYSQGQHTNPYNQSAAYANPYAQNMLQARLQSVMSQVYLWMTGGLLVTGAVAVLVVQTGLFTIVFNPAILLVLFLLELGIVWGISAGLGRMDPSTAIVLFFVYAALNGLTLSIFFFIYTGDSIASTFFTTGGMFALTSLYGYTTKRDLTTIGNIAFMALIGILLASLVNFFLRSPGLYWIITYLGVAIFIGLTAWDTQKIKRMVGATPAADVVNTQRIAIMGALNLYLDFINLFLFLLRIFGRRR